jgi:hypothetical protein
MYSTETLPAWFWVIYYFLILMTIAAALYAIKKSRNVWMSVMAVPIALSIPVVGIINGIESRLEHHDELEQWLLHLRNGSLWAYYILLGYIYLIVWWVRFICGGKKQSTIQLH